MSYKHVGKASPLKRIRLARGLNLLQLSVHSGCALSTLRKIERIEPNVIGQVKIMSLMKLAKCLECAPSDLLPFLNATVKGGGVKYTVDGAKRRFREEPTEPGP